MLALPHQHRSMAPAPLPPSKGMHRTVRPYLPYISPYPAYISPISCLQGHAPHGVRTITQPEPYPYPYPHPHPYPYPYP